MDTISIEIAGDRIALTFRREVGRIAKVRHLSPHEAHEVGLLMTGGALNVALNHDVPDANLALQIENDPYDRAWFMIGDPKGGRSLVIGLEGDLIRDVGNRLEDLRQILMGRRSTRAEPFIRPVTYCYLEDAKTN